MAGTQHDVVIIGGGIAGLTAAWDLRDRDVVVLEAEERVGGRMMSETREPYWLNMGAHLFGGPETLLGGLASELGLEIVDIPGNIMGVWAKGKLLTSGKIETYPLRLPLSIGARISFARTGLKIKSAVKGFNKIRRQPGEDLASYRTRRLAYDGDRTFAQALGSMHHDVRDLFQATTARITATMDEVSAGGGASLFSFVWSVGGKSQLARNLFGGSARLPREIQRQLGERVVVGAPVSNIVQSSDGVTVQYTVGGREQETTAKMAIVATPAPITRQILKDLPAETAAALDGIRYGPFIVCAFLTKETGPMPYDDVYAIAVSNKSFNMFFNHANPARKPGSRPPGGSLMVYAGADHARRIEGKSDAEIAEIFKADILSIFPEAAGIFEESIVQRWKYAIPYTHPGRYKLQAGLEKPLGHVVLAGDYLEMPAMEAAANTGREAARRVRSRLDE